MKSIIDEGAQYALVEDNEYTDDKTRKDLEVTIAMGNNKSAQSEESQWFTKKNYDKEVHVDRTWMLPVTKESITSIKGAGVNTIEVKTNSR